MLHSLAERVGFEPTEACTSAVFKTAAFDRSATSPRPAYGTVRGMQADRPASPAIPGGALVTGAASGIGRAIARRLAADGIVVGALDIVPAGLEATVRAIEAEDGRAVALPADVSEPIRVRAAVAELARVAGSSPLIAIHAAGIPGRGSFLETDERQWDRILAVHVRGAEAVARATLPAMLEAGWGRLILIGSDAAMTGAATVPYATAKAAMVGMTRSLAREVAAAGVRVNLVAPGPVETPMLLHDTPEQLEAELASVARGSFLAPEEIAETVAFLCGPGGEPFVGQVISPNGGTAFAG
jgi:3-oxoacyl-[acyl-carrier protein] reductase